VQVQAILINLYCATVSNAYEFYIHHIKKNFPSGAKYHNSPVLALAKKLAASSAVRSIFPV
jgi:hypothetical protein